jgi:hypothetical protein
MEVWEQSDERRIAAAQARWAAEFLNRRPFDHVLFVREGGWRYVTGTEGSAGDLCEAGSDGRATS